MGSTDLPRSGDRNLCKARSRDPYGIKERSTSRRRFYLRKHLRTKYGEVFEVAEVPNDILLRPVADGEPDAPDDTADRAKRTGTLLRAFWFGSVEIHRHPTEHIVNGTRTGGARRL